MPFLNFWLLSFITLLVLFLIFVVWASYQWKGLRWEERQKEYKPEEKTGVQGGEEREVMVESAPEDDVKAVLIQRIEGIRNNDASSIARLVDKGRYTRFDDWPPFERQKGSSALDREADGLNVLKECDYRTADWRINVFGNVALAALTINYWGKIRDLKFNIRSRITAFLARQEGGWKLVHEHWSRFPEDE